MVLEKLGGIFKNALNKITNAIFVDKKLVEEVVKEIQTALLSADVDRQLVLQLSEKIRELALNEKIKNVEKKEQLIALIHDELVKILGGEKKELQIVKGKQARIMFVGLYGNGKTTAIGKLANYYSKRGLKCCVVGLDVHRPAAPEQLEQLAERAKITAFIDKKEKNPEKIWKNIEEKISKFDLILVDTAGRDVLSDELIIELKKLNSLINPQYSILVMAADIGQAARKQVEGFVKAIKIDGVIITRMDGTAKGGGALVACQEAKAPVLYIGTGEKLQDIETFNPEAFVSRILGMGDLATLMEKVRTAVSEQEIKKTKRISEKFTLLDLYEQLESMSKIGPLGKIAELIPGFGGMKAKLPENMLQVQEEKLKHWRYAIQSMTKAEIDEPEKIHDTRISRIAKGAGISASEVRELIKQYKLLKDLIGPGGMNTAEGEEGQEIGEANLNQIKGMGISQKKLQKLAKRFGRRIPGL
ncbi:signal recognition particle protein [Candidatus Pacearchaeota archaeon CG06_land_8_20_14_3_00_35_12]|nr:MAG: signal recognition particle protein [Candidatus Pacearchaeota archaeon CG06_land_8_20_14_3_00_35_12]